MATTLEMLPQGTAVSLLTTELNSLSFGTGAVSSVGGTSGVFDNVIATSNFNGYPFAHVELVIAAPAAAISAGAVSVYFLRSIDATNYEDGSSSIRPLRSPDVVFFPVASASAQLLIGVNAVGEAAGSARVRIPPGKFKVLLFPASSLNATGVSGFASSGNTLKLLANTDTQQ